MTVSIDEINEFIDKLCDVVKLAEESGVSEIETSPNTYRMRNFVSFGNGGYLDLDRDPCDIVPEEESDG